VALSGHISGVFSMTEKETLIARLKELGVKLDREVNVTGTIQELTLRISELEEELDGDGGEETEVTQSGPLLSARQSSLAQIHIWLHYRKSSIDGNR
jgi:hypothetical protein